MRSMPSTRSAIAVDSLSPSRSRAATKPSSTWSSSDSASACNAGASVASPWVTPGSCSSSVKLTCRLGKSEAARRFRRAQAHHQIQLAAAQARCNAFTQLRLQRPQFLGQAGADLQEAVVDRAQLAAQRAPRGDPLAAGIGGHASNHGLCPVRAKGEWYPSALTRAPLPAP
ncbi:hypothetical protein G6F68_009782 [Rhizopus microsporus]|nr:hypothetical protein G6F68_009782 [Rhizopus microsporus]